MQEERNKYYEAKSVAVFSGVLTFLNFVLLNLFAPAMLSNIHKIIYWIVAIFTSLAVTLILYIVSRVAEEHEEKRQKILTELRSFKPVYLIMDNEIIDDIIDKEEIQFYGKQADGKILLIVRDKEGKTLYSSEKNIEFFLANFTLKK